jgi:hypothetical protein
MSQSAAIAASTTQRFAFFARGPPRPVLWGLRFLAAFFLAFFGAFLNATSRALRCFSMVSVLYAQSAQLAPQ